VGKLLLVTQILQYNCVDRFFYNFLIFHHKQAFSNLLSHITFWKCKSKSENIVWEKQKKIENNSLATPIQLESILIDKSALPIIILWFFKHNTLIDLIDKSNDFKIDTLTPHRPFNEKLINTCHPRYQGPQWVILHSMPTIQSLHL